MQTIIDLFSNYCLISAGSAWVVAQIFKIFTGIFHEHNFSITALLFGTGGMPSSHAATVMALVTSSILLYGASSFEFAVSFVLAMVVMRDATGVRREAGKQARVLNQLIHELFTTENETVIRADLKELLGHTPLQVFVGAVLGVIVALVLWPIFSAITVA